MAYLLQNGRVVLTSPISSGRYGHLTEKGSFKILEKERTRYSSIYGKIVDSRGNTILADADADMSVPPGGEFIPAPMHYFMRFTAPTECMPGTCQAIPRRMAVFGCRNSTQLHSQCSQRWHSGNGSRENADGTLHVAIATDIPMGPS